MDIFKAIRSAKLEKVQNVIETDGLTVLAGRNEDGQSPKSYLVDLIQSTEGSIRKFQAMSGEEKSVERRNKVLAGYKEIQSYLLDIELSLASQHLSNLSHTHTLEQANRAQGFIAQVSEMFSIS